MDYSEILFEVEGNAAIITLNRPAKLNAWTDNMEVEYRDALQRADADPDVRGIILTGAGRGFCAGADMGLLNRIADAGSRAGGDGGGHGGASLQANYEQRFSFPWAARKPLIGAINGHAVGLGLVHTLYCDMRFASENARFGTAFSSIGLVAEHGISWLLPRIIGTANALDLLYSARVIDAQEALAMGLVTRVLPQDELLPAAKEYVRGLERSSPRAMAIMKRQVYDAQFTDLAAATGVANEAMRQSFAAPDFREGLDAFAEKRPPRFPPLTPA